MSERELLDEEAANAKVEACGDEVYQVAVKHGASMFVLIVGEMCKRDDGEGMDMVISSSAHGTLTEIRGMMRAADEGLRSEAVIRIRRVMEQESDAADEAENKAEVA